MKRQLQGQHQVTTTLGDAVDSFIPAPLPPEPNIEWSSELRIQFDQALLALGGLNQISKLLPNPDLFLYTYIRKEAVLSSQIEGTQSSLSDLLNYEIGAKPGVPIDDVEEVSCYVAALTFGMKRLEEGFPLSNRLIKEIHSVLLSSGRGSSKSPGEFRRSQNWIGGTRPGNAQFVPPPQEKVLDCMSDLEKFIHNDPEPTAALVKAALAHVQFETIHPFLDGNGRLGRLLISFILCSEGILKEPILYLSLFFKQHRTVYYDLLTEVRKNGDWEVWLSFFAEAVTLTANQAIQTASELATAIQEGLEQIEQSKTRLSKSILEIYPTISEDLMVTPALVAKKSGLAQATVNSCLNYLEKIRILEEVTGKKRGRVYAFSRCIEILDKGLS
ncbi:MAG: Fic family protein [Proteobacteria bacterium]|nr:Fic family protein [Pseudomonadota bacterium]